MIIDSDGNFVNEYNYILDVIKKWILIDRNDVYSYNFLNFYIDFTDLNSIKEAINEIIDKFNLNCTINKISRQLNIVTVSLNYEDATLELGINVNE